MNNTYLVHHGVKGQKWYVRRYQNPDGTLTDAGKKHYAVHEYENKIRTDYRNRNKLSDAERKAVVNKHSDEIFSKLLLRESDSKNFTYNVSKGKNNSNEFIKQFASTQIKDLLDYTAVGVGTAAIGTLLAGPYAGVVASSIAIEGMSSAKGVSRIYRTVKYTSGG